MDVGMGDRAWGTCGSGAVNIEGDGVRTAGWNGRSPGGQAEARSAAQARRLRELRGDRAQGEGEGQAEAQAHARNRRER
eukprot:2022888-Pyramimonas_sp.AAC.1